MAETGIEDLIRGNRYDGESYGCWTALALIGIFLAIFLGLCLLIGYFAPPSNSNQNTMTEQRK